MQDIVKDFTQFTHKHHLWKVFSDWTYCAAAAISNVVDMRNRAVREAEYMRVIKPYSKEELFSFARIFATVEEQIQAGFDDVLGQVFMQLALGNHWKGQFFSLYCICQMMARMTLSDLLEKHIEEKGFISLGEPAAGSGAMVIACAEEVLSKGDNPTETMVAHATDLDPVAVRMTYIQLSLLAIPAVVTEGNTLSGTITDVWHTPSYILGGWSMREKEKPPSLPKKRVVKFGRKKEELDLPEIQVLKF